MKRLISCVALTAGLVFTSSSSADAWWRTRVVYRPVVVRPVVMQPVVVDPYYVAPIRPVYYAAPTVVYRPAYYFPAPVYVAAPVTPVYVGW